MGPGSSDRCTGPSDGFVVSKRHCPVELHLQFNKDLNIGNDIIQTTMDMRYEKQLKESRNKVKK